MVGKKPAPAWRPWQQDGEFKASLGYLVETLSHKRADSKRPREITQLVQCLPHKPVQYLIIHIKNTGKVAHICDHSAGEVVTAGYRGLPGQPG